MHPLAVPLGWQPIYSPVTISPTYRQVSCCPAGTDRGGEIPPRAYAHRFDALVGRPLRKRRNRNAANSRSNCRKSAVADALRLITFFSRNGMGQRRESPAQKTARQTHTTGEHSENSSRLWTTEGVSSLVHFLDGSVPGAPPPVRTLAKNRPTSSLGEPVSLSRRRSQSLA